MSVELKDFDVTKFAKQAVVEDMQRRSLSLVNNLVYAAAVKDGFLRGSFIASTGTPDYTITTTQDSNGSATYQKAIGVINALNEKDPLVVYFQSNLPYSYRIMEEGYSEQTPPRTLSIAIARAAK